MIFVTVGTHEQQFDRLIQEVDKLKEHGFIKEEVFIQSGYCSFEPKYCDHEKMINYDDMLNKMNEARIVITHGGPGSIMVPLSLNKIPIVVPRQSQFEEHVDDHQVLFCERLDSENKVIPIYNIKKLKTLIENYDAEVSGKSLIGSASNKLNFLNKFGKIADDLITD
ncbi:glycosyltransferase [Bacillus carboniphilus]|uniref:Glycosyltransferase n=1 Tax=Bacillus carboniphilus TaxID=86663 RepID=A0ABY9JQB6_9BACI|nr:glycosyltransferase [Bacillus carboniphilus]WLR41587.1 glycosyltransferase [Bacillus carboniphilus]